MQQICDECLHCAGLAKAGVDPANAGTSVQVCLNETTAHHHQIVQVQTKSNVGCRFSWTFQASQSHVSLAI